MKTIEWANGKLRLLDQTRLPAQEVYLELEDWHQVAAAIREMRVRGAPALGVAAAYGLALGARQISARSKPELLKALEQVADGLAATRPTARNLCWALERLKKVARDSSGNIAAALLSEAQQLQAEDEAANRQMGAFGAALIPEGAQVLTHCNAGALATAGYGTALGVVRAAREQGKSLRVYATETRPLLQGARLTAWELSQDGIPVTLITDSMAGYLMRQRRVDLVLVGADRIAANGDVANKIGTYALGVLAMEHGLPFYVAAPVSTLDLSLASGEEIPIEMRSPQEVTHLAGVAIAPPGVAALNPAFDVTPHQYVSAIITEKGIVREPYEERLRSLLAVAPRPSPPLSPSPARGGRGGQKKNVGRYIGPDPRTRRTQEIEREGP